MKPSPKCLTQLNLPLLAPRPTALPADKEEQLTQALIELLWSAASRAAGANRKEEE